MLRKKSKKLLKKQKITKRSSPKAILDEVFAFADQHPQDPCHCGCLNCEHNIIEALNKLDEVLKLTKGVKFEADFDLTKN